MSQYHIKNLQEYLQVYKKSQKVTVTVFLNSKNSRKNSYFCLTFWVSKLSDTDGGCKPSFGTAVVRFGFIHTKTKKTAPYPCSNCYGQPILAL